jgi:enoyl-CoA hydratase/carnithine racemase
MTLPTFQTLTLDVHDGIATVTLNRPDQLNAFNVAMRDELIAAIDATDADDAVRAVVITGAGRAFCAGADLGAGGDTFDSRSRHDPRADELTVDGVRRDGGGLVTLRLFRSLKPLIGAINGAAVGIGATMLLPLDVRLASTSARFGFVFARRGITPEAASSWFLPRLVGMQTALEWCISGRLFDAAEAHQRGLVRSLHAPADLLHEAHALARAMTTDSAPVSVALTRRMLWEMAGAAHPMVAHRLDSRVLQARGQAADVREGVQAFLDKRPAQWPNRVSQDLPDTVNLPAEPRFE